MTYAINSGRTARVSVTPTITAGAYSSGDVVGGLLTFALADTNGAAGIVRSVRIVDGDNEKAAATLYLFDSVPSTLADNAAFDFTDDAANLAKCFGKVAIAAADYTTVGADAAAWEDGLELDFDTPTGTIYGYLVCAATPSYGATSDLTITLTAYLI